MAIATKIGTTIAMSLSGCGSDRRRKKIATPVFCKPLSINIAIKRSRFYRVINDIRNPIKKPVYGRIALTIKVR